MEKLLYIKYNIKDCYEPFNQTFAKARNSFFENKEGQIVKGKISYNKDKYSYKFIKGKKFHWEKKTRYGYNEDSFISKEQDFCVESTFKDVSKIDCYDANSFFWKSSYYIQTIENYDLVTTISIYNSDTLHKEVKKLYKNGKEEVVDCFLLTNIEEHKFSSIATAVSSKEVESILWSDSVDVICYFETSAIGFKAENVGKKEVANQQNDNNNTTKDDDDQDVNFFENKTRESTSLELDENEKKLLDVKFDSQENIIELENNLQSQNSEQIEQSVEECEQTQIEELDLNALEYLEIPQELNALVDNQDIKEINEQQLQEIEIPQELNQLAYTKEISELQAIVEETQAEIQEQTQVEEAQTEEIQEQTQEIEIKQEVEELPNDEKLLATVENDQSKIEIKYVMGSLIEISKWENDVLNDNVVELNENYSRIAIINKERATGISFDTVQNKFNFGNWNSGDFCGVSLYSEGQSIVVESNGASVTTQNNGEKVVYNFSKEAPVQENEVETLSSDKTEILNGDTSYGSGGFYLQDNSYIKANFEVDKLKGTGKHYLENGELVYEGEFIGANYHGFGKMYKDQKVSYEGNFKEGKFDGDGKLFNNGKLMYMGSFDNGTISGFGASFECGSKKFIGQWKNNKKEGFGIEYENSNIQYVGNYKNGKKQGRVDFVENNTIVKRCIFEENSEVYAQIYNGKSLEYIGSVKDGVKNGLGIQFDKYYQKKCSGLFKNGELVTNFNVTIEQLNEIDVLSKLTGKDNLCGIKEAGENFVLDFMYNGSVYSGEVVDGVPNGMGNIVLLDAVYYGNFKNGLANGLGTLVLLNGKSYNGIFGTQDGETISCNSMEFSFSKM